ncbi:GTP-binding protein [bacterium]|nr:GTP-binding protein [bacterium]
MVKGESLQKALEISKKICMLGSFGVGKSSLVRRFVYDLFDERYLTTIGVQISHRSLPKRMSTFSRSPVNLKLILWDLAHIDTMNDVIKTYFRGSHGAVLVYDITRPESFDRTAEFLLPFREINPNSPVIFAVNKCDLLSPHHANYGLFLEKTKLFNGGSCLFTSARTGERVEEAFHQLGTLLLEADGR